MAKYRITDPGNYDKYEELVFISLNLRYWTKKWKEEYGQANAESVAIYNQKMDKWLSENTELDENDGNKPKYGNNKYKHNIVSNNKDR